MNSEAGANPLWHSCLLLSQTDEVSNQLNVVEHWGYYGAPTTDAPNSWSRAVKIKLGMDVDFTNNHGMLRREPKGLDLGMGLQGLSYEVTQENFERLQKRGADIVEGQNAAIEEAADYLGLMPAKTYRIYPYELDSALIYQVEKKKALKEGRESRLNRFELRLTWDSILPGLDHSYNCKSQVVDLLALVLNPKDIQEIRNTHPTIPRYSGDMEPILLHSTGPLSQRSKGGDTIFYRDGLNPEVRLSWTLPPQKVKALSPDTQCLFAIHRDHCAQVISIVKRLQRLEWLLINAKLAEQYHTYKEELIQEIRTHYRAFSFIQPKDDTKSFGITGLAYWFFSLPRDKDEDQLMKKINAASHLLNSLYMAAVEKWRITPDKFTPAMEAVVAYLPETEQRKLCRLLGRSYCSADEESSDEEIELEDENFSVAQMEESVASTSYA